MDNLRYELFHKIRSEVRNNIDCSLNTPMRHILCIGIKNNIDQFIYYDGCYPIQVSLEYESALYE